MTNQVASVLVKRAWPDSRVTDVLRDTIRVDRRYNRASVSPHHIAAIATSTSIDDYAPSKRTRNLLFSGGGHFKDFRGQLSFQKKYFVRLKMH